MSSNVTLECIRAIFEFEEKVREEFVKGYETWAHCIMVMNNAVAKQHLIDDTYFRMGSLADGGFSARSFAEEEFLFEGDFLIEILELPNRLVAPIPDKPGFYRVWNDGNLAENFIGIGRLFMQDVRPEMKRRFNMSLKLMRPGFLLGVSIKNSVENVTKLYDGYPCIKEIMADVFEVPEERVDCDMKTEFNGPATTHRIMIGIDGEDKFEMSFDVVVCARLTVWPPEAKDWHDRPREWPPRWLVDEIVREHKVHLVAKPSTEFTTETNDEWRLTFLAEKRLVQEWTAQMRMTYYIFKILFYSHFKMEIEGKTLPSYLAKTTMYWLCEELHPDEWTDANLVTNIQKLLSKLSRYLGNGVLPHYFVQSINLLGSLPSSLLDRIRAQNISYILEDPISCVPQRFGEVRNRMEMIIKLSQIWGDHYGKLASHLQARLPLPRQRLGFFESGLGLLTGSALENANGALSPDIMKLGVAMVSEMLTGLGTKPKSHGRTDPLKHRTDDHPYSSNSNVKSPSVPFKQENQPEPTTQADRVQLTESEMNLLLEVAAAAFSSTDVRPKERKNHSPTFSIEPKVKQPKQ